MRLFTPLRPAPRAFLAAANPAMKIAAAATLMLILFFCVDAVTAGVVLVGLLGAVALSGLSPRTLAGRTWPILLTALSVGVLNVLLATPQGGSQVRIGPVDASATALANGVGLGLRLAGIAFAGVLAMTTTDPTRLADSLVQQLRVSPRFAVGALAAARLIPVMALEWQILSLARRARGVTGRGPIQAVRVFFGKLVALLIGAVRRATRLATAMEARGFGARDCRTNARHEEVRRADWLLLGGAMALGMLAVGISVLLGTWRFLFG
ncbi:MAG TPA: energy-coupling factor transporter transmembrane component T [Candidatus Limnocylindria bacterium]|nr:energy-coupling factor transporter transmembrane component T [Candidatus Limnocylindria bacterium]